MSPDSRDPRYWGGPSIPIEIQAEEVKHSRTIPPSVSTARDYYRFFQLSDADVVGKRVLDVGAGPAGFIPHLLSMGVDAYAVDPRFRPNKIQELIDEVRKPYNPKTDLLEVTAALEITLAKFADSFFSRPDRYVKGFATRLRFPDDHFDLVVSRQLYLKYLSEEANIFRPAMREIVRVTKPGGIIKIDPSPKLEEPLEQVRESLYEEVSALMDSAKHGIGEFKLDDAGEDLLKRLNLAASLLELTRDGKIEQPVFRQVEGIDDRYVLEMTKRKAA